MIIINALLIVLVIWLYFFFSISLALNLSLVIAEQVLTFYPASLIVQGRPFQYCVTMIRTCSESFQCWLILLFELIRKFVFLPKTGWRILLNCPFQICWTHYLVRQPNLGWFHLGNSTFLWCSQVKVNFCSGDWTALLCYLHTWQ